MQTVTELFRRLEDDNINYAILRNYEILPELRGGDLTRNTDIDLVVDSADVPKVRVLLASLASDLGWDVLTECEHFGRSPARHHNIEIFHFYNLAPLDFLQVDVFHGYLTWGLPLMDEAQMLQKRVYDRTRSLTHIDPLKENIFRLVQIHGLGRSSRTAKKRARYRTKIEALCQKREEDFYKYVRSVFGPFGVRATVALRAGDESAFHRNLTLAKLWFFTSYAIKHPISTIWQLTERFRENQTRFHRDPCGIVLPVHTTCQHAQETFERAMGMLVQLNMLDEWASESSDDCQHRCPQILEQGGIVVRSTDRNSATLIVESGDEAGAICEKVLSHYTRRHRVLHSKQSVEKMERQAAVVQS